MTYYYHLTEKCVAEWEKYLATFERLDQVTQAAIIRALIEDIKKFDRQVGETTLTLKQASEESNYSTSHLQRLLDEGSIPNPGAPGVPLIMRKDLPRLLRPIAVSRSLKRKTPVIMTEPQSGTTVSRIMDRAIGKTTNSA